jgi:glutamyl-tRNA reductase
MLTGLKLVNFAPCETSEALLKESTQGQVFIMRTCQRTLVVGFNNLPERVLSTLSQSAASLAQIQNKSSGPEFYRGLEAYQFLLETICGLKSRILGENEIVHQFKEAYIEFMATPRPNRLVQNLLEKLFKDAKDIRSRHLRNIGLQTYAGITRKILIDRVRASERVLIFGSGDLAEDILKISERRFQFTLCARNTQRLNELRSKFEFDILPWDQRNQALELGVLVNTIGTTKEIFNQEAVNNLEEKGNPKKLIIDLASPSPLKVSRAFSETKCYFGLEDIFQQGERLNQEKHLKVESATKAIKEMTQHRHNHFTLHLPFGWDELQFA